MQWTPEGNRKGPSRDLFLIEVEVSIEEKGFLIVRKDWEMR